MCDAKLVRKNFSSLFAPIYLRFINRGSLKEQDKKHFAALSLSGKLCSFNELLLNSQG